MTIALIECFPFQIVKEVTRVIPQPDVSSAHLSASSLFEDGLLLYNVSAKQEHHNCENPNEGEVDLNVQPGINVSAQMVNRRNCVLAVLKAIDVLRVEDWEHVANDHCTAYNCL